jgi:sulfide:quinone oxidoreductase
MPRRARARTLRRMSETTSVPLRVLVAGGGAAAIEAVLALRALAGERVIVELLAPVDEFVHRPSSVTTPFSGVAAPRVALDRLGVTRHYGALAAVEPGLRRVRTTGGAELAYDRLIVATGARSVAGVHGATLFHGPVSTGAVEGALRGARDRVLFTLPGTATWTLPLYELALLAAAQRPDDGPELTVVTPESRPLELFGRVASDAVAQLLSDAGIGFVGDTIAEAVLDGSLLVRGGGLLSADAVIALPSLLGPMLEGLPANAGGFIPIDRHARVVGVPDVFAAGDVTAEPIKQGGLATQQADAAAEAIAAEAGAAVDPRPYTPVLRGLLLTGGRPLYLRHELDGRAPIARELDSVPALASRSSLWWPPAKIAGRYLSGFLASGEPGGRLTDRAPRAESAGEQQLVTLLADADAAADFERDRDDSARALGESA